MALRLLRIQLLNFLGINQALHTKDRREKKKALAIAALLSVCYASLFVCSSIYSYSISKTCRAFGMPKLLPAMMMAGSCIAGIITTVFKTDGFLFCFKDYDMLMSLPIKTRTIIASRLLLLYMTNFAFTLLFMLPAGIIYAIYSTVSWYYWPVFIITLFIIPLLPLILAVIAGVCISWISSKFRSSNIISITLEMLFLCAVLILAFGSTSMKAADLVSIGKTLQNMLYKIYPPARLYLDGVFSQNVVSLLLFTGISIVFFAAFLFVMERHFKSLNSALMGKTVKKKATEINVKESSALKALYKKEMKLFFSSPLYLFNNSAGIVLLLLFACYVGLFGMGQQLEQILNIPGFLDIAVSYTSVIFAFCIVISNTSCCSVSLEGRNLWILQSLPLKISDIFLSKILFNLTLTLPASLVAAVIVAKKLQMSVMSFTLLITGIFLYCVFSAAAGLLINLLLPNFTWTSTVSVIKQSASALVSIFSGMSAAFVPIGIRLIFPGLSVYSVLLISYGIVALLLMGCISVLFIKGRILFCRLPE